MGGRFVVRVGGFAAVVACAVLVACGGGGGGTPPVGGGSTATPVPTATPTLAPATQSTSAPLSTTGTTAIPLGGISSGSTNVVSSGSFTAPQTNAAANGSVTMQAALPTSPSGITAPQMQTLHLRHGQTLCATPCTLTPIAYIVFSVSSTVTITQSPAVTLTLPSAPAAGNAYLVVYANGTWNQVAGPIATAATLTFPAGAVNPSPFTIVANTPYVFAVVTGTITTPTPTTTATPTQAPTSTPGNAPPLPPISGANSAPSGYSPYDVASAFYYPVQSGFNGAGRAIAIIGDEPPSASDLTTYVNKWSIPSSPLNSYSVVAITGTTPGGPDPGGLGEATLDVETVIGLAPGATVTFYNTNGDLSNQAFLLGEQQVAATNGSKGPDAFSISFGGCEQYPLPVSPPGSAPPDATVFAQMNAAGVAVTASSGDQGDNCFTGLTSPADAFGVNYPASDPSVIGVGGNESNPSTASLLNPVAWNDNFFGGQGSTGGGVSTTFALPAYQNGLTGAASTSYRNVPDVAMPAEGTLLILNGKLQEFGGTSWSAPELAAMMADLDSYCGGRPANAVAEWYKAYSTSHANFVDVTSGNNMWNATDSKATYAAAAGYDNVTGLGMPLGMSVATSMCPSRVWTGGPAANFAAQLGSHEEYGAATDTKLPYYERFNPANDLGARSASESTRATLVLRDTPTKATDEQTVIAALRAAGFTIEQTFPNHSLIAVSAPASTMGRYFRTTMHNVSQGSFGTKYSNASALVLPAAIAPYVRTVLADTLVARKPLHYRMR